MKIKELVDKLDEFFDLSKKKQKKKHDKLLKIISSLEEKKAELKKELKKEGEKDISGDEYYNLCKEFKVVSKLIRKAKKHNGSENASEDLSE